MSEWTNCTKRICDVTTGCEADDRGIAHFLLIMGVNLV